MVINFLFGLFRLQQCCLTLRTMDGGEPGDFSLLILFLFKKLLTVFKRFTDIPVYKVVGNWPKFIKYYLRFRFIHNFICRMQRSNEYARLYCGCLLPRHPISK